MPKYWPLAELHTVNARSFLALYALKGNLFLVLNFFSLITLVLITPNRHNSEQDSTEEEVGRGKREGARRLGKRLRGVEAGGNAALGISAADQA